jgi:hypothetical protein
LATATEPPILVPEPGIHLSPRRKVGESNENGIHMHGDRLLLKNKVLRNMPMEGSCTCIFSAVNANHASMPSAAGNAFRFGHRLCPFSLHTNSPFVEPSKMQIHAAVVSLLLLAAALAQARLMYLPLYRKPLSKCAQRNTNLALHLGTLASATYCDGKNQSATWNNIRNRCVIQPCIK